MKHIKKDLRNISSDYLGKGWLDVDAIMELMTGREHNDNPNKDDSEFPKFDQKKLRRKVTALMELLEMPEVEKDQLLDSADINIQLEELHRRWAERIGKTLGGADSAQKDPAGDCWQDFSVYRSGEIHGLG